MTLRFSEKSPTTPPNWTRVQLVADSASSFQPGVQQHLDILREKAELGTTALTHSLVWGHYLGDLLPLQTMESPVSKWQVPLTLKFSLSQMWKRYHTWYTNYWFNAAQGQREFQSWLQEDCASLQSIRRNEKRECQYLEMTSSPALQSPCPLSCWTIASTWIIGLVFLTL